MSEARDPYAVLGVPRTATLRQIRMAYFARARRSHPDLVGVRGLALMRELNEAWEILKDATRRAAHDASTGGTDAAGSPGGQSSIEDDPDRPFWTGAAGPPPGRPWGLVLDFGIFAGWSLGEISRRDRGYLQWLLNRPEARAFREEIVHLLDPEGPESVDKGRRGSR